LYKRGTFYPYAPRQADRRDNSLELRVQGHARRAWPLLRPAVPLLVGVARRHRLAQPLQ
ncbi:hypothetical protein ACFWHD_33280, partial [Streptomyces sp. NPDC060275]